MTEKRFKPVFSGRYNDVFIGVKDNKEDELLMTLDTIDKLNELSTENEQLQTQLSQLAQSNREGVKKVQSLAKEKENLKDEVYEEMDNALTVLMELYEDTPLTSQKKMNNLYNRLESLRDELK